MYLKMLNMDSFVKEFWEKHECKLKEFWTSKKSHKNDIIISAITFFGYILFCFKHYL